MNQLTSKSDIGEITGRLNSIEANLIETCDHSNGLHALINRIDRVPPVSNTQTNNERPIAPQEEEPDVTTRLNRINVLLVARNQELAHLKEHLLRTI
jgi:hypothetical protein